MNQDYIIELAREADIDWHQHWVIGEDENRLERFYWLAVAQEREQCAQLCEQQDEANTQYRYDYRRGVLDCAQAIRLRGEQ